MSLWKRIASRLRRGEDAGGDARGPDLGMTYADFERDKPRKEALLSGAGFSEPDGDREPARRADEDPEEPTGAGTLR